MNNTPKPSHEYSLSVRQSYQILRIMNLFRSESCDIISILLYNMMPSHSLTGCSISFLKALKLANPLPAKRPANLPNAQPTALPTRGPPSSPAPLQTKNSPIGLAIASVPRDTSPLNSLDLEASDNRLFSPRKDSAT